MADYGEGKEIVGSTVAGTGGRFETAVSGVPEDAYLTAMATDQVGNTSEFSPNFRASDVFAIDGVGCTVSDSWGCQN